MYSGFGVAARPAAQSDRLQARDVPVPGPERLARLFVEWLDYVVEGFFHRVKSPHIGA